MMIVYTRTHMLTTLLAQNTLQLLVHSPLYRYHYSLEIIINNYDDITIGHDSGTEMGPGSTIIRLLSVIITSRESFIGMMTPDKLLVGTIFSSGESF